MFYILIVDHVTCVTAVVLFPPRRTSPTLLNSTVIRTAHPHPKKKKNVIFPLPATYIDDDAMMTEVPIAQLADCSRVITAVTST